MTQNKQSGPLADLSSGQVALRLWRDYMRAHTGKVAVALFCMVVVALTTGVLAGLVEPALGRLDEAGELWMVFVVPAIYVGVIVIRGIASYVQAVLMEVLALRIMERIQADMFGRLIAADLAFIDRRGTGTLLSRFISDVFQLRAALTGVVTSAVRDSLTTVALIGVMFYTNWRIAAFAFIVFPVSALFIVSIGRRMRRVARNTQAEIAEMTRLLDDAFKGIREVKAYAMEEHEQRRAGGTFGALYHLNLKAAKVRARSIPVLEALGGLIFAGILAYGGYQVFMGQTESEAFMGFFVAALMAYQPMRKILGINIVLQSGVAAAERVFEVIDHKPAVRDRPDATPIAVAGGAVRLDGVEFSYGGDAVALHGVSLDAPAGRTTAVVGPSGAGKSTILSLIPRFYDVVSGSVTVDGQDVRTVTTDSLRGAIALVSQDTGLFNDTVRANIAYGRPGATEAEIVEAARNAAADEFIDALPQGYDTEVGERGVMLSGEIGRAHV